MGENLRVVAQQADEGNHLRVIGDRVSEEQERLAAIDKKIERYGGEEYFQDKFGLGREELVKQVEFGAYSGPFIDALVPDDPADLTNPAAKPCPVGGIVAEAYAEGGLDEVQAKLNGLSMLDKRFKLEISQETRTRTFTREMLKKKTQSQ